MLAYVVKRILSMVPVFFFVALISFAIIALFPGDFYTGALLSLVMSGMSYNDAHEAVDALRVANGMNKAWFVQFWVWFEGVITEGDFGVSWRYILQPENGLGWTLVIAGSSMIWAWVLGIPVGVLAALRKDTWIDHLIAGWTYVGFSFPPYVWGTLFFVFMFHCVNDNVIGPGIWGLVGWELVGTPLTWYKVGSHILHLLPAWVIVGAPMFAVVARHTRISVSDALSDPYVTVARGKGLRERRVLFKHALRNAVNPLVSIFGLTLPTLITSMILLGPVLGFDTFGQFFIHAAQMQSQHRLTACLLIYASFLLLGNLIADLLLVAVDPRIRYE